MRKARLIIDKNGDLSGDTSALFRIYQHQKELGIKMKDIPLCG
jgi:hypothetical protein